jgi:hypothetical protein
MLYILPKGKERLLKLKKINKKLVYTIKNSLPTTNI